MTVWEKYTDKQREEYVEFLNSYCSLSKLFNQKATETGAPYLDSKFQENIYSRCFNSKIVDVGNTPHDIVSEIDNVKYGIGVKTWLNSKPSYQKVMQLKRYKNEIDNCKTTRSKIKKIAEIKNGRMRADYNRLGLSESKNIYHFITRDKGKIVLQETTYPLIDIPSLRVEKKTDTAIFFKDKLKEYKYTFADHQVWMYFGEKGDTKKIGEVKVAIDDDPFDKLKKISNHNVEVITPKDYLYLPLYAYGSGKVNKSSGLNAWNAAPKQKGSNTKRPKYEVYLPIPVDLWKIHSARYWFDKNVDMCNYNAYKDKTGESSYKFKLHMPDGTTCNALIGQQGFKSFQTSPQSKLGEWLLGMLDIDAQRKQANVPAEEVVTKEMLNNLGFDSVKLWREDPTRPNDIWIDIAKIGAFEDYMEEKLIDDTE